MSDFPPRRRAGTQMIPNASVATEHFEWDSTLVKRSRQLRHVIEHDRCLQLPASLPVTGINFEQFDADPSPPKTCCQSGFQKVDADVRRVAHADERTH